ncbi:hypothetical protein OPV22_004197 [Ensete ventricosum]|uniref:Cyclic nucleotide-binding domain-containing protein n=1 Tax=Ensete ventricosum TaxID=4639 RepID=A0AAV8S2W8_ENSVE|nr:hypothetical protein OPV22_004197 [Ensete ventricosum]
MPGGRWRPPTSTRPRPCSVSRSPALPRLPLSPPSSPATSSSPTDPRSPTRRLIWSLYQQLQGKRVFCLDMLPPLQRLKPGVLQVHKGNEITKYFVSSGFASIHANSVTDIVAVEVVPVDHIDPSLVQKGLAVYT